MRSPGGGRKITFDQWAMEMARTAALWSECARRQVGSVIVVDRRIIATGCNGSAPGDRTCLQGACPRGRLSYEQFPGHAESGSNSYDSGPGSCNAIHSETNAIAQAAQFGGGTLGASLYTTYLPCDGCWRFIRAAGVARLVYLDGDRLVELLRDNNDFSQTGKGVVLR